MVYIILKIGANLKKLSDSRNKNYNYITFAGIYISLQMQQTILYMQYTTNAVSSGFPILTNAWEVVMRKSHKNDLFLLIIIQTCK